MENDSPGSAPDTNRRVTLRDVARLAGVSHQTVSRAINDKGEIDPETRRRVLEVVQRLRYRPSRHARGLVRPDTITIGLVVADVVNPFFPELIAGVIGAADQRGWKVLISTTQDDPGREPELLRSLAGQVDALIGYLYAPDAEIAAAVEGLPLVVMNRSTRHTRFSVVEVDVRTGVRAAVDHLIGRGHRRIGMIDCPVPDPARREALLEAAAAHGVPIAADAIVTVDQTRSGGEAGLARLRETRPDITAILAFNDMVAMGAHRAARRLGLSMPGDVALVGFDGLSFGELLDPPLTTVDIDKRGMGELAVAQAARLLAGETPPAAMAPTALLVRGSA
ncbi:LacI family DNA-binding transcriptional regulator [Actinoplanes sp. NPDC049802]|uniref:LacI family DNA-binding transcriptional regulator n=1 Tax=Actinoplanes sp. NPDC049802 TaxID=3154742 RepID=UPI0033C83452